MGNVGSVHAELAQTKPKQDNGRERITRQFTTHRDRFSSLVILLENPAEDAEHGWRRALVVVGKLWIHAVDRVQVLGQIIRSYAGKIGFLCSHVCNHRNRWDLDHNSDIDFLVEGNAFSPQFRLCFFDCRIACSNVIHCAHHREHDLHGTKSGCPQCCAQLCFEHFRHIQAKPQRAVT